jgi:hypothetical protein
LRPPRPPDRRRWPRVRDCRSVSGREVTCRRVAPLVTAQASGPASVRAAAPTAPGQYIARSTTSRDADVTVVVKPPLSPGTPAAFSTARPPLGTHTAAVATAPLSIRNVKLTVAAASHGFVTRK